MKNYLIIILYWDVIKIAYSIVDTKETRCYPNEILMYMQDFIEETAEEFGYDEEMLYASIKVEGDKLC